MDGFMVLVAELAQYVVDEGRDVLGAFSQWWDPERHDIEAVIEIFSELTAFDRLI